MDCEIVSSDYSLIGTQEIGVPSYVIDLAKEKLLEFLDFEPDQVILESARSVIWNDGSLGCAEDGKYYTKALVPGYKIVFQMGNDHFVLHTDAKGTRIVMVSKNKGT